MNRISLFLIFSIYLFSCTTTVPIFVDVEPLVDGLTLSEPNGTITVFHEGDEIPKHTELAILKAEIAHDKDPENMILDAYKYKALQLGADGILITKNFYNVGFQRDKRKPGINPVDIREMEAKAIKFE